LVMCMLLSIAFAHFPPKYDFSQIFAQQQVRAGPSQVHVSYPGSDQMLVIWVSPATSDPSEVIYGTTPYQLSLSAHGTADSYTFQGYTSGGIHSALLTGLSVSTLYYYQVGGPGQWSTTYSFKSAPTVGTEGVIIGAVGDVGADPDSQKTVKGLIDLSNQERLDFILHAGDLSYANNYNPGGPVWDRYGDMLEPLIAYSPYCPSVGNHESINNFTGYRDRYGLTQLEKKLQRC